ncbi:MAG: glycosyltransferase family 4 protein [Candidatus Helarchaeota archaeon]|nr:glycosyltransferase family 4 protein [Candidatus Helarchaeota archaeon]
MKKTKIAMLAPIAWRTPPREYGPWELVVNNLTEGLVNKGFDITLFATKDSITNAKLHAVCARGYEEDKSINPEVWKLMHISEVFERADEFDIIHNHFDYPALTYSKLVKTPVLTTIHGFSSPDIYPVYEKYNNNTFYVSISESDRYEKLEYIATVYNGINLDEFTYNPNGGHYLLFLGRICREKGTHEAIQIAKKSNKKLMIAGIIQEVDYYEEKVKPYIDNDTIKFLSLIDSKERDKLLGGALAFLHPVMSPERFGLVMVEAMACGTPVIGFNLGSVREIINHDKTGFVINNVKEAVKCIKDLDKINRIDCRKRVEKYFTVENMVEGYIKVYDKILSLESKK